MQKRIRDSRTIQMLAIASVALLGALAADTAMSQAHAALIFHSTMDDASSIHQPQVSQASYGTVGEAVRVPGVISYVAGQFGTATQIATGGNAFDGKIWFKGENFDFADADQDGGRLDMWVRFDQDPHSVGNVFLMSEWNGTRNMNMELTGSPSAMMLDTYGDVANNERTNYEKFRVNPRYEQAWQDIAAGEWHLFTWLWRNNGDQHKDEIHYYIDGVDVGSDYNGNLPGSVAEFPNVGLASTYSGGIAVTIDEIYSFDSWDVSGATGNFANLQIPEGVTLTYPMDGRYPVWGSPVPTRRIDFAFYVINKQTDPCECNVFLDDALIGTVTASSQAYTEVAAPGPLANGTYTFQVKCEGDRLVSAVNQFTVDSTEVGTDLRSMGQFKQPYHDGN